MPFFASSEVKRYILAKYGSSFNELATTFPFLLVFWILEGWTRVFLGDEVSCSYSSEEIEEGCTGFFVLSSYVDPL